MHDPERAEFEKLERRLFWQLAVLVAIATGKDGEKAVFDANRATEGRDSKFPEVTK